MRTVLASAADRRYGWWLLNLVGSVHANARGVFDAIVLYDLGLSPFQRRLARSIRGVELRPVPPFAPHAREAFTWKPWIWTQLDADVALYLDAGVTVLRPPHAILDAVRERGYFVVSQERRLGEIVPSDYWALYGAPESWADRTYVAAGIIGFRPGGAFYRDVLVPTFEDCLEGRNLGFSAGEEEALNFGLHATDAPVIRDAPTFRHDQTILNLRLLGAIEEPDVGELARFGGHRSPRDHPEQVIWNHRKRGDYRYLGRVPYRLPAALVGAPFGLAYRARWWTRMNAWAFRPSTYVGKARRVLASLRR